MQNTAILQANNRRTQREDSNSVSLSNTQTRTIEEKVKDPKVTCLEEFKRKQLENSKLLLDAVQQHKIKSYDKIFDYEELAEEVYSISRFKNDGFNGIIFTIIQHFHKGWAV